MEFAEFIEILEMDELNVTGEEQVRWSLQAQSPV